MNRIRLAAAAFLGLVCLSSADVPTRQINIEARLVQVSNSTLRDSGFDTGWGVAIEALFRRQEGQPAWSFGLTYDHMKCEEDFLEIETFGAQVGLLGQFDRNRSASDNQFLWRAAVGLFRTQTKNLGDDEENGFGYELGIQYGRNDGSRNPSFAILYSVRPDAYNQNTTRFVGLVSFPLSGS